jgi:hypothetical protein
VGSDDEIDAKLAGIGRRVQQRNEAAAADIREKLAALGCLELAEALKDKFGARLAYLGPPEGFPHGHPYNFDLRGHANASASTVHGHTPSTPQRPNNEPYRGRPNQDKRKARKPPARDKGRDPQPTWHDLYRDR